MPSIGALYQLFDLLPFVYLPSLQPGRSLPSRSVRRTSDTLPQVPLKCRNPASEVELISRSWKCPGYLYTTRYFPRSSNGITLTNSRPLVALFIAVARSVSYCFDIESRVNCATAYCDDTAWA